MYHFVKWCFCAYLDPFCWPIHKYNLKPARMLWVEILGWILHDAFNIWTGSHYYRAYIRQIVGAVHPQPLHSFLINLLMKLITNTTYMLGLQILSSCVPINPWNTCPTEKLLMCSCVQYLILCYGVGFRRKSNNGLRDWEVKKCWVFIPMRTLLGNTQLLWPLGRVASTSI